MTPAWMLTMTAKEPATLVGGGTLGRRLPAHRAHQHATTGDQMTGGAQKRVTAGCAKCDRPAGAALRRRRVELW